MEKEVAKRRGGVLFVCLVYAPLFDMISDDSSFFYFTINKNQPIKLLTRY